jgi:hypothetical protein
MWKNPIMADFIGVADRLLQASSKDEAEVVDSLLKVVTDMAKDFPKRSVAFDTTVVEEIPMQEYEDIKNDPTCAVIMSSSTSDNLEEDLQPAAASTGPRSYSEVAAEPPMETRVQMGATMPSLTFHFLGRNGRPDTSHARRAYLDSGANLSFMSSRAFHRDRHSWGNRVKVRVVRGHPVTLADGRSHARITHIVQGLPVVMGSAIYEVDFVVMEPAGVDYLLGFGFFYTWRLQLNAYDAFARLGVEPALSLLPKEDYRPYQRLPLNFDFKGFTFPVEHESKM